jgi:YesN/AraC family two-component response regulator
MRILSDIAKELADDLVLLVDDEEYVVNVLKEIISHWVPNIDSVRSGKEALEMIKKKDYDFILSDIRMPDMNGMELYQRLREVNSELTGKFIFLSGDTQSDDVRCFLDLTMVKYLNKPFQVRELIDAMLEVKHFKPRLLKVEEG